MKGAGPAVIIYLIFAWIFAIALIFKGIVWGITCIVKSIKEKKETPTEKYTYTTRHIRPRIIKPIMREQPPVKKQYTPSIGETKTLW